ncbi:MAG: RNA 2',3'-cyclic phosphodiesterase [Nitrospirae bacterium]|nr:RNA 2',3'-cyclic phosphodiesterase [Nitrospirota bacterium]
MRSFIAIELPEAVRYALSGIEEELKKSRADVRWVKPENIHLTLKFLGDVEEKNTEKITEILKDICRRFKPFALEIKGMGVFPHPRSPRVLWTGMDISDTLENLQKEIEDAMTSLGFEREDRRFTAHLTLGRFRSLLTRIKNAQRPWRWLFRK